jgi:sugar-specific transcriptional regulator TrmB
MCVLISEHFFYEKYFFNLEIIMTIEQVLKDLGLQDKESEVYLALLKTPGVQPASIIAKKTDLNRTTVYKTLVKLTKIGLATKTMKHGILCFFSEKPDSRLEDLLHKRRKQLELLNDHLVSILPDIKNMQKQETLMPKMRYYEGIEGVKRVYRDTLAEGKTIYAFENVEQMDDKVKDYIFDEYVPKRVAEKIFAYVIVPKTKENINYHKADKNNMRESKIISKGAFPVEIEINIYGQKTAFFSYKSEEMFGVILESQSIANSMRAIFDLCWKFAN